MVRALDAAHRAGFARFTVERGQTPDERIDKRVEVVIVQRAVHPAIALGDRSGMAHFLLSCEEAYRSDLKLARTSSEKSFGCSHAAK